MKWSEYLYGDLEYQLTYFDPSLVKLGVKMTEGGFPSYLVKGIPASIPPPLMNVIRLSDKSWEKGHDDLDWLCSKLSLPPEAIYQLTLDIGNSEISHITNLRWRQADGKNRLHLDCPGTVPGLFVGQLSGGEREHVLIEFACASARSSGDHFPTLLILDGCPSVVSGDFFQKYTNHLQGPENHFQTIVCIPSQNFNLDSISWEGWEVMRFSKSDKGISIDQTLKISA